MTTGDPDSIDAVIADGKALALRSPVEARQLTERLLWHRAERKTMAARIARDLTQVQAYLGISGKVTTALETLSQQLFEQLLGVVQEKLTLALHEILDQPIRFVAKADFRRGSATVEFSIDRDGNTEDVMKGQGGSVANILSVGLRMFALTTLDEAQHRRFLVLDEQDCWLRPDLVPKLVRIVHDAGKALGFQVLMISHHDIAAFERYADKIYQLTPRSGGLVEVNELAEPVVEQDANT